MAGDRSDLVVDPPSSVPLLLRPGLRIAQRMTGKDPLPARLLAHFPKGALGAALFELSAAGGGDMDRTDGARVLAVARITASLVTGCPFCLDMNAATWRRAGLSAAELQALVDGTAAPSFDVRCALAQRYARALSVTPVVVDATLIEGLRSAFSAREIVILAETIAQVGFWSRFNQGLGVPSAGFFVDDGVCRLPAPAPAGAAIVDAADGGASARAQREEP